LVILPAFDMVQLKLGGDMMSIFNEARKELWSEIQGLSDEMLNKRPAEDEWSIQEVIDHLKKIDLMALQILKEQIKACTG
jgi:uncharacterized damage-inducible protein DinB